MFVTFLVPIRKGIKHDKCIFFCCNVFTQCDLIKNWGRRYLHKVTSSKFGATLFGMASQHRVTWCQFYNCVEFIAKFEEFVVLCRYIMKTSLL